MNKYIEYFKDVVKRTSLLSTCASKQVGALLVLNNRILATSFNGVASGKKHCNEIFVEADGDGWMPAREEHHQWSLLNECHSEQNIIAFCAKNGIRTENTTLYVSLSPCASCAKLLLAAGIKEVFYLEEYDKDIEGIKFLRNNDIVCEKI
jgi:dCMP deaminase